MTETDPDYADDARISCLPPEQDEPQTEEEQEWADKALVLQAESTNWEMLAKSRLAELEQVRSERNNRQGQLEIAQINFINTRAELEQAKATIGRLENQLQIEAQTNMRLGLTYQARLATAEADTKRLALAGETLTEGLDTYWSTLPEGEEAIRAWREAIDQAKGEQP